MKEKIKCIICRKPVTNELLKKDGFYFCDNTCEGEYWHKYESKKISTEKMMMFQITLLNLEKKYGDEVSKERIFKEIPKQEMIFGEAFEEAFEEATKILNQRDMDRFEFERVITLLKQTGYLFEPREGVLRRMDTVEEKTVKGVKKKTKQR
tara:strand:+ start:127 stop:579 length:453 start_codon:yes stop_codon:yes gene_type:complete